MSNMFFEVLDAISDFYKDNLEIQADCMLWLKQHTNEKSIVAKYDDWFSDLHLCNKCGTPLDFYTYRQPVPYEETVTYETVVEEYCPHCDGRKITKEDL